MHTLLYRTNEITNAYQDIFGRAMLIVVVVGGANGDVVIWFFSLDQI